MVLLLKFTVNESVILNYNSKLKQSYNSISI